MAIRNVGNNDSQNIIHDVQNDAKATKPTTEQPSVNTVKEQSAPPSTSSQLEKSLRARTTLGSSSVRSAIDAKLGSTEIKRPAISREYQPAINNLQKGVSRLSNATVRYQSHIEKALNSTKIDTSNFLHHASTAHKSLSESRDGLAAHSKDLAANLDQIIKQLGALTNAVKTDAGDFGFNVTSSLKALSSSMSKLEKNANIVANGQAMALPKVIDANNQVALVPKQIASQAQDFAKTMQAAIEPVATQAKNLSTQVESFSLGGLWGSVKSAVGGLVDKAKGALSDLADKAFKFVYNIKEKASGYIDEYIGPITKAIGTGLISIFKSDNNPVGKAVDLNTLVTNTKELRDLAAAAKNGDTNAASKLQSTYGYTTQTFPKPGTTWIAANFAGGELVNGKVTAQHFPTANTAKSLTAQTADPNKPADIEKLLFNNWNKSTLGFSKGMTLMDKDGKPRTVNSMAEYQQVIAENRAKMGIPTQDGKPIAVQLSLEGGGGKGKRYAPVFEEMYNAGVVPASVSGTSAGAIAASLVAGGADPRKIDEISKDPAIKKFFDATIEGPGLLEGRELYRYIDKTLRELTGITDRPVTFADLPMPLYLTATKLADSQAGNDMTKLADRTFIFSKENTPNTPVAMAVVASASVPGAFDPIEMVDPATGRTIRLCDGGVVDNLPVDSAHNNLPQIAVSLDSPNGSNRSSNDLGSPQPFPPGNLISNNPIGNAKIGLDLQAKAATGQRDYHDAVRPKPGTFVLAVPTWNLQDFSKQDTTFGFEYDKNVDPGLDTQTAQITDNFLRQYLGKLTDPTASGTNLHDRPATNDFSRTFSAGGHTWTATHAAGSDNVAFRRDDGETHNLAIGNDRMSDWVADDASFGDLGNRLRDVINAREKFLFGV